MTKHYPFIDVSIDFEKENFILNYSKEINEYKADGLIIGHINLDEETRKPLWLYNGSKSLDYVLPLVEELKKLNKKVILSFGGGYGSDIEELSSKDLDDCFNELITIFKPNQLDLNLDSSLYNPESIDLIFKSIKKLIDNNQNCSDLLISISLNIKPSYGLGEEEFEILKCAKDNQIDFIVNGLFSDILNPDWSNKLGDASIDSLKQLLSQLKQLYLDQSNDDANLYKRIAISPMIGVNNNSTIFTIDDTITLSKFASKNCLSFTSQLSLNNDDPIINQNQSEKGLYCKTFVNSIQSNDRSN